MAYGPIYPLEGQPKRFRDVASEVALDTLDQLVRVLGPHDPAPLQRERLGEWRFSVLDQQVERPPAPVELVQ
ncbi:MAG TPA: hypothetical protein VGF75_04595 [Candidatus Saccharimonadales bacterium]|jgi:hypothetical protein